MDQTAIFGPFFVVMLLTLVVWITMFARRIPFIQSLDPEIDLTEPGKLDALSPPHVAAPSDNFKNLFEMPVLFYAICLMLFATEQVDGLAVGAAWTFAGFRILHSLVHCTFNHVLVRFGVYLVSALALWFMVLRAAWSFAAG